MTQYFAGAAASDLVAAVDAPNVVSPTYETPSDPDVVRSTEPEPVPAAPASTPPESGAALPGRAEATPPLPENLTSPPAPTVSTDSPFGDTPPKEDGASTPVISRPAAVNPRVGRYLNRPASAPAK